MADSVVFQVADPARLTRWYTVSFMTRTATAFQSDEHAQGARYQRQTHNEEQVAFTLHHVFAHASQSNYVQPEHESYTTGRICGDPLRTPIPDKLVLAL